MHYFQYLSSYQYPRDNSRWWKNISVSTGKFLHAEHNNYDSLISDTIVAWNDK